MAKSIVVPELGESVVEATVGTLQVSVLAAAASVLAVLPIAYLVGRHRSRAGSLANAVVISTFALPGLLIALSIRFWTVRSATAFELLGDTMGLLIFAYVVRFGSLAMGVTLAAVRAVPTRLSDAAATLGASRLRRLVTIDLPLMAPGLGAAAGLVLLSVMKELPISLLVSPIGYTNLTTRIFSSFQDAFVAAIAALSNTGPAYATIAGDGKSFASFDFIQRVILCGAMVLGRIETLAAIALFNPENWSGSSARSKKTGKSRSEGSISGW